MEFVPPVFTVMYCSAPELLALVALSVLQYSLRYGVSGSTAISLIIFGTVPITLFKDYERAYTIGQMSLALSKKYPNPRLEAGTCVLLGEFLFSHKLPYKIWLEYLVKAYRAGSIAGDQTFSLYAYGIYVIECFSQGKPLIEIKKEIELAKLDIPKDTELTGVFLDFNFCVESAALGYDILSGEKSYNHFQEYMTRVFNHEKLAALELLIDSILFLHLSIAYMMEDWQMVEKIALRLLKCFNQRRYLVMAQLGEIYFYSGLLAGVRYGQVKQGQRRRYKKMLNDSINFIKEIAAHNPANYEAKYLLLMAVLQLNSNEVNEAISYYKKAIASANKQELVHIEAIAHEYVGRWLFEQGQPNSAKGYINDALYSFEQWGALGKSKNMQDKYATLLIEKSADLKTMMTQISSTTSHSNIINLIDLAAIMKSAQAISSHVNFQDLLIDLLKVMTETSGAKRCALLLMRDNELLLEAINHANDPYPTVLIPEQIETRQDLCIPIIRYVERTKEIIVLDNAVNSVYKTDKYVAQHILLSILCLPILHQTKLVGVLYLENDLVSGTFTNKHIEISQLLASQAAISIEITQLHAAYNQFVPHQFLDLLGKRSIIDVHLGDHIEKNMTILFSDIRGFTHLSEQITPDATFKFINQYLSYMEPVVINNDGFIDKYIGDGIMALFPDQVDKAVDAAIQMQKILNEENSKLAVSNATRIRIGIGINYGRLMLGTLGGANRIETSVLGDAVNLASRIESLTKEYDSTLLVSDDAYRNLQDPSRFNARFAGLIKLPGKEKYTKIFEIFDGDPEHLLFAKLSIVKWYDAAITNFYTENYQEALQLFQRCLAVLPSDKLIKRFIQDCEKKLAVI